jgi:hypothetical protein
MALHVLAAKGKTPSSSSASISDFFGGQCLTTVAVRQRERRSGAARRGVPGIDYSDFT